PETASLARKRAEALAAAGHGGAAGDAFFAAAELDARNRTELTSRGAEQLLRSGEIARGRGVMERVLRSIGWRVPRTAVGALLAVVIRRAALALRGLRAREVWAPGPRTTLNLLRMDATWALASSAMMQEVDRKSTRL